MRARTGLWEPWGGNAPGPPGPTRVFLLMFLERILPCRARFQTASGRTFAIPSSDFTITTRSTCWQA